MMKNTTLSSFGTAIPTPKRRVVSYNNAVTSLLSSSNSSTNRYNNHHNHHHITTGTTGTGSSLLRSSHLFLSQETCIVFSFGSKRIYSGYVGEPLPRHIGIIPKRIDTIEDDHDAFMAIRSSLSDMFKALLVSDPSSLKILILESTFMTRRLKHLLVKVLFLVFKSPSISFINSSIVSLFPTGNLSGLVVECSSSGTIITPVFDGRPLFSAMKWSSTTGSGAYISSILENMLFKNHSDPKDLLGVVEWKQLDTEKGEFMTVQDPSLVNHMMDRVPLSHRSNILENLKTHMSVKKTDSVPPQSPPNKEKTDHTSIVDPIVISLTRTSQVHLSQSFLNRIASSTLFDMTDQDTLLLSTTHMKPPPHDTALPDPPEVSLQDLILESVSACPVDTTLAICSNIVIVGGTSMLSGFQERLGQELRESCQKRPALAHLVPRIEMATLPFAPCLVPWIGGSLFGMSPYQPLQQLSYEEIMSPILPTLSKDLMEDISLILNTKGFVMLRDWTDLREE